MSPFSKADLKRYGWTPMPRSMSISLAAIDPSATKPTSPSELPVPESELARKVQAYAENELPPRTFDHSMRVYYYGAAIITQHFPHLQPMLETYFLCCMLHDIGTAPQFQRNTALSFEFFGGFFALTLLQQEEFAAPKLQTESVCEAIVRHQDLGKTGNVQSVEAVLQLATVFDNIGENPQLVHRETIANVVQAYPRRGWSGCFAETIQKEVALKPWAHTTAIEGFAERVEANTLMEPFDK